MGSRATYRSTLRELMAHGNTWPALEAYLLQHANLPGPRANLELAQCFAEQLADKVLNQGDLDRLHRWTQYVAPENTPAVFLPFCAYIALGALYHHVDTTRRQAIIRQLREAANDTRWRIREAVAMAFQRIAEQNISTIVTMFSTWIDHASMKEQRAILVTLAHSPILGDANTVRFALHIAGKVLAGIRTKGAEERKHDDFRILRKGLAYTISVFVAHLPEEGFLFLTKWAVEPDADIRWILKENIKKRRLIKRFPAQVAAIQTMVSI